MRIAHHYIFYLLLLSKFLHAQDSRQYAFTNYTVKEGLASYNAVSIVQDDQGYMWIGTINGLQRFDGTKFLTFRHNPSDTNSLPDNYIYQLLVDRHQNLWVLLNNGKVGIFDTKKFRFKEARATLSKQRYIKAIRGLSEDSEGNLIYAIMHAEVLTYNKEHNEFASVYNPFTAPPNWRIASVVDDSVSKKYWISTDSGMAVYNKTTHKLSYRGHNAEKEPFIEQYGNIEGLGNYGVDSKHRLWFLSWPFTADYPLVYCYDLNTQKAVVEAYKIASPDKKYVEPSFILQQKNGTLWLRGLNVFAKYNESQKKFDPVYNGHLNGKGISYEMVNCLFEDREQNIWVATDNNGIYVFNPSRQFFRSIDHMNPVTQKQGTGTLLSFTSTNSGHLLASAWNEGLYKYDDRLNNVDLNMNDGGLLRQYSIWGMCPLKDKETIWMVGQPAVIMLYNQVSNSIKKYNPSIFRGRTIRQVVEDHDGNIWLGTHGIGVYKWTPANATHHFDSGFSKLNNIPDVKIQKMLVDSKGFVWVCTVSEGVFKINPANDSVMVHLTTNGPGSLRLSSNDVASALVYNDSIIIFLTGVLNLYNTKSNSISYITASEGLPSEAAVGIGKDRNGNVWISLLNGLCRMNLEKKTFTYFDRTDGIANDNFDLATYQLPDGRMIFGSTNDFLVFNPDDIKTDAAPRDVTITGFRLFNTPLSVDSLLQLKTIRLSHAQNSVSIGFSSLSYFNRNKISYYYKLQKIDKEWRKATEANEAVYNYLPPGSYTFSVRAESADGVPSINSTQLRLVISPPFWQSWLFYSLLALLAGGLVYWLDKERMKRKENMHKMRSDIAGNLYEEVNTALNNINILSEIATLKAGSEPAKSIEYLEQIHEKSHNMIIAMDDMLWSIDPDNDSMRKTIDRMKEYTDTLKNHHATKIDILVDKKIEKLELNMKLRLEWFLLFREIIKTIVHCGAQNNGIHIALEKLHIVCTFQFQNGEGDIQQLESLLQTNDMNKRLKEMHAKLKIYIDKAHSLVVLKIPASR